MSFDDDARDADFRRALALAPSDKARAAAVIFRTCTRAELAEIIEWADADIADQLRALAERFPEETE